MTREEEVMAAVRPMFDADTLRAVEASLPELVADSEEMCISVKWRARWVYRKALELCGYDEQGRWIAGGGR